MTFGPDDKQVPVCFVGSPISLSLSALQDKYGIFYRSLGLRPFLCRTARQVPPSSSCFQTFIQVPCARTSPAAGLFKCSTFCCVRPVDLWNNFWPSILSVVLHYQLVLVRSTGPNQRREEHGFCNYRAKNVVIWKQNGVKNTTSTVYACSLSPLFLRSLWEAK